MPILEWSGTYSVGVAILDDEHRQFFDLLNRLYDSIIDGSNNDAKTRIFLDRFLEFAVEHCGREERMLAAAHYPDIKAVHDHHEKLHETIKGFRRIVSEQGGISVALTNFLMEWVLQHILKEDKKCGAFLNTAGIY